MMNQSLFTYSFGKDGQSCCSSLYLPVNKKAGREDKRRGGTRKENRGKNWRKDGVERRVKAEEGKRAE